ncbi:FecR family protein [Carboxylicivirga taeanensis]|uniref:FecR family protein n=1 Tax=Carboxylicivirga taeanensis TaxID=1416875 RepID=UPI003F6DD763
MSLDKTDIIDKVLRDELSESDLRLFYEELKDDEQLRVQYYIQKSLWVKLGICQIEPLNNASVNIADVWQRIRVRRGRRILNHIKKYAATLLIGLLIGSVVAHLTGLWPRVMKKGSEAAVFSFTTGDKSFSTLKLPDGSMLTLNANSTVTYQDKNQRYVTLSGEAYFDIYHDPNKPFVIDFGRMQVVDLGTKFNIKADEQSNLIETTLLEGDVDVIVDEDKITSLEPGQMATYHKINNTVVLTRADSTVVMGWKGKRFVFKGQTLQSIMDELGAWYNIEIEWASEKSAAERIYLNIERYESIDDILEVIAIKFDLKFEYEKNNEGKNRIVIR